MGSFSELDIDRQSYRKHAPPAGICFLSMIEDLCVLCGFNPETEPTVIAKYVADYSCTPGQFWDQLAVDHPMRSLSYAVRRYLEECDYSTDNNSIDVIDSLEKRGDTISRGSIAA